MHKIVPRLLSKFNPILAITFAKINLNSAIAITR